MHASKLPANEESHEEAASKDPHDPLECELHVEQRGNEEGQSQGIGLGEERSKVALGM